MSRLLSGLLSLGRRSAEPPVDYDIAKAQAADRDPAVRRGLATRANVQPEFLYFLAEDADPGVRRRIAANPATPVQADALLATDGDEEVRREIAAKIGRLAPGLSSEERVRAGAIVAGILETLARDQARSVRRALAEELQAAANVPACVAERLARDSDVAVSCPLLRNSPLLADDFLLEIIRSRPVRQALDAIAGRTVVSEDVTDALVDADDHPAIATLLRNHGAQIREETLDRLVERAADFDDWHAPLTARPRLSARAVKTLSRFVAEALLDSLLDRDDIAPDVRASIGDRVRRRIGGNAGDPDEPAAERVCRLADAGTLDGEAVRVAMMNGDRAFVMEALAALSAVPPAVVQKAFTLAAAKGVAAIAWKAGLPADLATELQLRVARVRPADALKPRGGGYALSEKDMAWQLEFLGA